jgi:hypothetical protein
LNTIAPDLEQHKLNGAYVFVGYNYYSPRNSTQGTLAPLSAAQSRVNSLLPNNAAGHVRGYHDLSSFINTYVLGGVTYADGTTSVAISTAANTNPFTAAYPVAGGAFGVNPITFAMNNVATPSVPATSTANPNLVNGIVRINWAITSGVDVGAGARVPVVVGPMTLTNPGASLNPVVNGSWVVRSFEQNYYSGNNLTSAVPTGTNAYPVVVQANGYIVSPAGTNAWEKTAAQDPTSTATALAFVRHGGLTAAQIAAHKLVRVVINVVPAEVVAQAKAAGIDTNNPEALVNFANSLQ